MDKSEKPVSSDKKTFPSPTQSIPGLEPIVIHAIEHVFPNIQDQQSAFKHLLYRKDSKPKLQLALLFYSKGDIEKFCDSSAQSHPHFWMDEIVHTFSTMEKAEEWVKSISGSQTGNI